MRRLATLVVVVLVLLGADRLAVGVTESRAEDAIAGRLGGVAGVRVDIRSFPFVGRLLVGGRVSRLDVRLNELAGHGVTIAEMRFDARGVDLDRGLLFSGKVKITDVDRVLVTATISQTAIREVTGVDVDLVEGKVDATIGEGVIRLSVAGLPPIRVPAPDDTLLPCQAVIRVEDRQLVASCEADELPPFIAGAVVS